MKRGLSILSIAILCALLAGSIFATEVYGRFSTENYLTIATIDSRPLFIDRILYTAFTDIGYRTVHMVSSPQTGFDMVARGERDAVITPNPTIPTLYPELLQVPVVIDVTYNVAFVREGSNLVVNKWSDLSGLTVGILAERSYIPTQIPADATIITAESNNLVLSDLVQEKCDVVILARRSHEVISLPGGIIECGVAEQLPEYLYLNEKYEFLLPELTRSLNNIFADGRGERIFNNELIPGNHQKRTIIHIYSGNSELAREDQLSKALRSKFTEDISLEWYTVALNTKSFSLDPNRLVSFAHLLRQDCVSRNVAAIIVSGEDALEFLKEHYNVLFQNVPILFYNVGDNYSTLIRGYESYFTGIEEQLAAYETLSAALTLFPDTQNVYVINDYKTEGLRYKSAMEEQLKPFTERLSIEYNENMDRESLLEQLKELPPHSMVFFGSYFCDANGQYYSLNETKRALAAVCEVPIFSLYAIDSPYNAIGGKCVDYEKYGETIADMLKSLLDGEDVESIPVIADAAGYSRWVFDKDMLDKFGVKENALPQGSHVINKTLSIWEADPRFAITLSILLVVSFAVIISISVLANNQRARKEQLISEAKIREVKERLERIINTSPIFYMLTIDGRVVEINENMKRSVGLNVGDEVRPIHVVPEHRDRVMGKVLQENVDVSDIMCIKMANGEAHRIIVNATTVDYDQRRAIANWAFDIEQTEKQKDQLQTARQSLQSLLDMLPVAVRVVDVGTKELTYANKAAFTLFGVSASEDVLGQSYLRFIPETQPDGRDSLELIDSVRLAEDPVTVEMVMSKNNGELFEAEIMACLVDYDGRLSSLGIMLDLTADKEYQRMLAATAEKEKEANLLKSRFLVNMSHEIRTPMNAIIGLTEIELHKDFLGEPKEIYRKINVSAKNLLAIINDILDLSKIEADKVELYEDEFELEEVLNSALLVASPRLDGKSVEFMLNGAMDLPRYVKGDRTRLWQILKNFLDNSAKFTEAGKIVLTVFVDYEHCDAETVTINFIVEDTGIGMDAEQINRIFIPYQQIYNEVQKRYSGTGLGMTISKQLCELMGGTLKVESNLGRGTTVHLSIPFKRSPNSEPTEPHGLNGVNVLAVDDDMLSLEIMERLLKNSNANCTTARSGMEAMEIIIEHRDRGDSFDVILLDYMMDGLNGLETARQIQLALSKAPKLLMVTAYQRLLLKSELEESGIDGVIEKPFVPSHFISRLCVTLGLEADIEEGTTKANYKFKDVNVLLCEDYRLNQEVATGMLAQFGVATTVAENGSEGLEILEGDIAFDLILMDLQMPVMDGYQATQIIRADPRFASTPIIGLTADAMIEVVEKCLSIGMNDHIAKPIEFERMYNILKKWLPESKRVLGDGVTMPATDPLSEALARFGGDELKYRDALLEFSRLLPDEWQVYDEAIANPEETKRFIHKLKGTAGTVAEQGIYECAIAFEASLREGRADQNLYNRLVETCQAVRKKIISEVEGVSNAVPESGSSAELAVILAALRDALQEHDPEVIEPIVNLLRSKTWPPSAQQNLQQLYMHINRYDFEAALEALAEMIAGE